MNIVPHTSKKGFPGYVVFGDLTRTYKDDLLGIGGFFGKNFGGRTGYWFSDSALPRVQQFLQGVSTGALQPGSAGYLYKSQSPQKQPLPLQQPYQQPYQQQPYQQQFPQHFPQIGQQQFPQLAQQQPQFQQQQSQLGQQQPQFPQQPMQQPMQQPIQQFPQQPIQQQQPQPQSFQPQKVIPSNVIFTEQPIRNVQYQTVTWTVQLPEIGMIICAQSQDGTTRLSYKIINIAQHNGYTDEIFAVPYTNQTQIPSRIQICNGKWQARGLMEDHTIVFMSCEDYEKSLIPQPSSGSATFTPQNSPQPSSGSATLTEFPQGNPPGFPASAVEPGNPGTSVTPQNSPQPSSQQSSPQPSSSAQSSILASALQQALPLTSTIQ